MKNNPDQDWENLFEQLPLDTKPREEHHAELKDRVMQAFDEHMLGPPEQKPIVHAKNSQTSGINRIGRILMTYKAPYWTAAAIAIGFFAWLGQGSNTAFAFEDLVNSFVSCTTARYDADFSIDGEVKSTQKHYYMAPGRSRMESDSMIIVNDSKRIMTLNTTTKLATVIDFDNKRLLEGEMQRNLFESMRDILQSAKSPSSNVQVKKLGERQIDGKKAIGFHLDAPIGVGATYEFVIWADPDTRFPIEIEVPTPSANGEQANGKLVMKNYEFNIDLDEELFPTEVPEGYKVQETVKANLDSNKMTEEAFVAGLKKFVAATGKLPNGIDPVALSQQLSAYVQDQKVPADKMQQTMLDLMMPLIQFPATLAQQEADYDAKEAEYGDETRAIFWYKPADQENYRVIYADLSVKESPTNPSTN